MRGAIDFESVLTLIPQEDSEQVRGRQTPMKSSVAPIGTDNKLAVSKDSYREPVLGTT